MACGVGMQYEAVMSRFFDERLCSTYIAIDACVTLSKLACIFTYMSSTHLTQREQSSLSFRTMSLCRHLPDMT